MVIWAEVSSMVLSPESSPGSIQRPATLSPSLGPSCLRGIKNLFKHDAVSQHLNA